MASSDPYLIDPAQLAFGWAGDGMALGCIDLARFGGEPCLLHPPPFPLIGLGDPSHPFARSLDAVVETPVTIDRLIAGIVAHPRAAATVIQVLRATEDAAPDHALMLESMGFAMLQGSAEHVDWMAARQGANPAPPGRLVTTRDGATLHVVIDRPAARNAIDRAMRDALFAAFTVAALDGEIKRVRLRSTGPAFSVGADLAEFGTTRDPATAHAIRCATLPAYPLSRCGGIVDVHVQGACIGSALEMVAFAGQVTAAPSAWFQLPELAMGILPGAGGCVSVPRRIGRQRAALMMLSGRRIDAVTALRWGLIDAIVDKPPVDPGCADDD